MILLGRNFRGDQTRECANDRIVLRQPIVNSGMSPPDPDSLVSDLQEGRRRFLAPVAGVRPELHRYCARMTCSGSQGEAGAQGTLAPAPYGPSDIVGSRSAVHWSFRLARHLAAPLLP